MDWKSNRRRETHAHDEGGRDFLVDHLEELERLVGGPRAVHPGLKIPAGASQEAVEALAKAEPNVAGQMAGKTVVKTIFVTDRMLNFVVK